MQAALRPGALQFISCIPLHCSVAAAAAKPEWHTIQYTHILCSRQGKAQPDLNEPATPHVLSFVRRASDFLSLDSAGCKRQEASHESRRRCRRRCRRRHLAR